MNCFGATIIWKDTLDNESSIWRINQNIINKIEIEKLRKNIVCLNFCKECKSVFIFHKSDKQVLHFVRNKTFLFHKKIMTFFIKSTINYDSLKSFMLMLSMNKCVAISYGVPLEII